MCTALYPRETSEECGLTVSGLDKVGVILFEFVGEAQLMEVHVFRTETFTGDPVETEGMETTNNDMLIHVCCACRPILLLE